MPSGKPILYWDTSVLLAWIKGELRTGFEMDGVRAVAESIHKNHCILLTSALTDAEVLDSKLDDEAKDKLREFFKRKNCQKVNADPPVMRLASEIRNYYEQQRAMDGLPTLTTPDAIHLATAILYKANEFHTFDANNEPRKRRGLLPLDGNVAGYPLKVCKPPIPAQLPLPYDGEAQRIIRVHPHGKPDDPATT